MKTNLSILLTSFIMSMTFTGCILPYEETFICNKGLNTGNCQSVSENYHDTFVNQDDIPLTLKQKEFLIEQLEDQNIIDNSYTGKDKIIDWIQLSVLSKPRLVHILNYYDFDDNTKYRINQLISKRTTLTPGTTMNTPINTKELLKFMRLENEYLHEENLHLKTKNKD